ncbi:MAG: tRNA lysidine(34) synthetase TilS [Rhodospirillaceae bacterium]|nr:MAG: tRNA lysidine(34) synthetase TilS [Rhodospirillaceae bacterium]
MPQTNPIGEAEFSTLMTSCEDFAQVSQIAVAVSGGADSLCLAIMLQAWGAERGVEVTALTVDHGLRKESRGEAEQVKTWLEAIGLKQHILTWAPNKHQTTAVQARARKARYALMSDWCQAQGVDHLFLAHHQDDQAETVLMRLKKQSTLYGFGAMALARDVHGLKLCRPLLNVPKSRLIATLKTKGQHWIEDPSNHNTDFERVRVRALLVDLAKQGVSADRLSGAATSARLVCDVLDKAADRLVDIAVEPGKTLKITPDFLNAPPRIYERALSKILRDVGGNVYPPSPDKLRRLRAWLESGEHGARTLAGVLVRTKASGIYVSVESPRQNCKKTDK